MPGRVKWCRSQCFCNISPKGTYSCLAWFNPVISLHFHAAALLVRDSELWPIVQIRKPGKHDTIGFLLHANQANKNDCVLALGPGQHIPNHLVAE